MSAISASARAMPAKSAAPFVRRFSNVTIRRCCQIDSPGVIAVEGRHLEVAVGHGVVQAHRPMFPAS